MAAMWMVRSDGGRRYDNFRDRGAAGIGFPEIAPIAKPGVDKKTLIDTFRDATPGVTAKSAIAAVSPPGSDLGRDILASPDGFAFEQPRIVVEVNHRKQAIDSQGIRSFVGGRHKDDRCLYVSAGGFTRDAGYEADRSSVPMVSWTVEDLTKALIDNYEQADAKTKALVSLRSFYVPAADD